MAEKGAQRSTPTRNIVVWGVDICGRGGMGAGYHSGGMAGSVLGTRVIARDIPALMDKTTDGAVMGGSEARKGELAGGHGRGGMWVGRGRGAGTTGARGERGRRGTGVGVGERGRVLAVRLTVQQGVGEGGGGGVLPIGDWRVERLGGGDEDLERAGGGDGLLEGLERGDVGLRARTRRGRCVGR